MEVKIGKKKFTLEKVSIYISDLYTEFIRLKNDLITLEGDFEMVRLEGEIARNESETVIDNLRSDLKMIKAAKQLKKDALEGASEANIKRNEILKEIVELNGYEYIEMDWLKNFSEDDFTALIGDLMGGSKKKEKVESST